jgi:putative transposase
MGRPYSRDLRERVVAEDGLSRRKAASYFAVGISTVINWLRRFRETGSVLPGKMGGHKLHAIAGEHRAWLLIRIEGKDFTFARARCRACRARPQSRLQDGVELRSRREARLQMAFLRTVIVF